MATNKTNTSKTNTSKTKTSKTSKANAVIVPATGTATSNASTVNAGTVVAKKPSNKQQVFAAWQKMVVANGGVCPKPSSIALQLHQQFNLTGLVALPTLAGWLSSWSAGKNLPSGQPKNVIPAFIKGTYRTVSTTPTTTTK